MLDTQRTLRNKARLQPQENCALFALYSIQKSKIYSNHSENYLPATALCSIIVAHYHKVAVPAIYFLNLLSQNLSKSIGTPLQAFCARNFGGITA